MNKFSTWFSENPNKILGEEKEGTNRYGKMMFVKGDLESNLSKFDVSPSLLPALRDYNEVVQFDAMENIQKSIEATKEQDKVQKPSKNLKRKPSKSNYVDELPKQNYELFSEAEAYNFLNPAMEKEDVEVWIFYCNNQNRPIHPFLVNKFQFTPNDQWFKSRMESGHLCYDPAKKEYLPRVIYYYGNIYEKIGDLNRLQFTESLIGETQKDVQLKKLNEIKPQYLVLTGPVSERLSLDPLSKFCQDFLITVEGDESTILEHYKNFLRNVDSSEQKTDVYLSYLYNYILDGDRLPNSLDKDEKDLVKRKCSIENRHFMSVFLEYLDSYTREKIEYSWNYENNGFVDPNYNQVPVMFVMSKYFKDLILKIRSEQREGVAFQEINGTGVCGYDVGVGKTLTSILTVAQFIQSGRAVRPIIVVPKPTYHKWIGEINGNFDEEGNLTGVGILPQYKINSLYNLSNEILEQGFEVEDNTITIMTYQGLKKLGFGAEYNQKFADDLLLVLEQHDTKSSFREQALKNAKITKGELSSARKGTEVLMEESMWDYMIMDEAHNANKIFTAVKGETKDDGKKEPSRFQYSSGGQPSLLGRKAFFLSQFIQSNANGLGNINLLTATPFTNNPLNVYNIFALANFDRLKNYGIANINTFFEKYVDVTIEKVVTSKGTIDSKEVIKGWKNKVALQKILFGIVNYKSAEESPEVKRPLKVTLPLISENVNGQIIMLEPKNQISTILKPSIWQKENQKEISAWLKAALQDREAMKKAPHLVADIMASKNCLSPHIYANIEPENIDYKDFINQSPKLKATMLAIKGINEYHEDNNQERSGQIIYMNGGISYMPLIKEYLLNELGYKRNVAKEGKTTFDEVEILAGDSIDDEQKEDVKNYFNAGKIKIVIGSSTIREGIDLQKQTTTLHNLWIDWNPTDYKQLEGRLWRFGNVWKYVRIISYLVTGGSDAFKFQKLEEKTARINDIFDRKDKSNILEVSDEDREAVKWALIDDVSIIVNEQTKEKKESNSKEIRVIQENIDKINNLQKDLEYNVTKEKYIEDLVAKVLDKMEFEGITPEMSTIQKATILARNSRKIYDNYSLDWQTRNEFNYSFSSGLSQLKKNQKNIAFLDEKFIKERNVSVFEIDAPILVEEYEANIEKIREKNAILSSAEYIEQEIAKLEAEKSQKDAGSFTPEIVAANILKLNEKCLTLDSIKEQVIQPKPNPAFKTPQTGAGTDEIVDTAVIENENPEINVKNANENIKIKLVNEDDYVPAGQKKAIEAILSENLMAGKVGRTNYYLKDLGNGIYEATVSLKETTTYGGQPKIVSHKYKFSIKNQKTSVKIPHQTINKIKRLSKYLQENYKSIGGHYDYTQYYYKTENPVSSKKFKALKDEYDKKDAELTEVCDKYSPSQLYDQIDDENFRGLNDSGDFGNAELEKGIETEQEHKDTFEKLANGEIDVSEAIVETAKDHIEEDPEYYDKLEEMETKTEKENIQSAIEALQSTLEFIDESDKKDFESAIDALETTLEFI